MRVWITKHLPTLLTWAVLILAVVLAGNAESLEKLNQIGGFVAGFSGALAFIWLVAAYRLQSQELGLQREELALQRASLDAQREELRKMGKYAAMEQIAKILNQFEDSIAKSADGMPKTVGELPVAIANGMIHWKTIFESADKQLVHDLHMQWQKTLAPCQEFLARVASAVELYEEAAGKVLLPPGKSPASRIYFSIESIRDIPFVRNYAGIAQMVATELFLLEPGLDAIALRGFEATDSIMPGIVKAEALEELRKKVRQNEAWRPTSKDCR
jgi:hypothetical protein